MKDFIELVAKEMPDMKESKLQLRNLRLHANGVFSNVYKGTLILPDTSKEIAIKKTWPTSTEKNFEYAFLTGQGRERHKNIVQMLYSFSNITHDKKICESFIFDYMPDTLDSLIRNKILDSIDIRLYAWQLFNGLLYLESINVVHRDLKPVNTLVDHSLGILKIGDFGSAKQLSNPLKKSTAYQVTRFYRPPELLLCDKVMNLQFYDCSVDVWSAGCILGEMIRGKTLFSGRDSVHQLKVICTILGAPSKSDLEAMRSRIRIAGKEKGIGFEKVLLKATSDELNLIKKILVYKPKDRVRGRKLLHDNFFNSILQEGAKRSNGTFIKDIITPEDIQEALFTPDKERISKNGFRKQDLTFEESREKIKSVDRITDHETQDFSLDQDYRKVTLEESNENEKKGKKSTESEK